MAALPDQAGPGQEAQRRDGAPTLLTMAAEDDTSSPASEALRKIIENAAKSGHSDDVMTFLAACASKIAAAEERAERAEVRSRQLATNLTSRERRLASRERDLELMLGQLASPSSGVGSGLAGRRPAGSARLQNEELIRRSQKDMVDQPSFSGGDRRGSRPRRISRREVPRRAAPRRDALGHVLRPDPAAARDAAGLIAALRAYRKWAGEPSYRDMAARCKHAAGASTMCRALRRDQLPPLWLVDAIVAGCGGSDEDRDAFAAAWRVINDTAPEENEPPSAGADRPVLRALPTRDIPASTHRLTTAAQDLAAVWPRRI